MRPASFLTADWGTLTWPRGQSVPPVISLPTWTMSGMQSAALSWVMTSLE